MKTVTRMLQNLSNWELLEVGGVKSRNYSLKRADQLAGISKCFQSIILVGENPERNLSITSQIDQFIENRRDDYK